MKANERLEIAGLAAMLLGGLVIMGAGPGSCVPRPPPPCLEICGEPICGVDGVTYTCGEPEASCNGVAVAYPGPCSTCTSDEECSPDQHCSTSDGECLPAPGCTVPGTACPDVCGGVCVDDPVGCLDDSDCGSDEACVFGPCPLCDGPGCECYGICEPAEICYADEDCGPGWHCSTSDGDCRSACPTGDGACIAVCAGICVEDLPPPPPPPPPYECNDAGLDCVNGDECILVVCEDACPPGAFCIWEGVCWGYCDGAPPPPPPPLPPPPTDCRDTGCTPDSYCGDCWGSFVCIPNGAIC